MTHSSKLVVLLVLALSGPGAFASPAWFWPATQFARNNLAGPNKFFTALAVAEDNGYILDYQSLARRFSPFLAGVDSLTHRQGRHTEGLTARLSSYLQNLDQSTTRIYGHTNGRLIYDPTLNDYDVCFSGPPVLIALQASPVWQRSITTDLSKQFRRKDSVRRVGCTYAFPLHLSAETQALVWGIKNLKSERGGDWGLSVIALALRPDAVKTQAVPNLAGFRLRYQITNVALVIFHGSKASTYFARCRGGQCPNLVNAAAPVAFAQLRPVARPR